MDATPSPSPAPTARAADHGDRDGAIVAWRGLDAAGVQVVGEIPAKLPLPRMPAFDTELMREFASGALAIAVLGLLEAIAMAKAIAAQTHQKLDMNQQCLSEGLANFTGTFFQCIPGSGSLTRSAINQQAGASTQWSGVVSAAGVALIMIGFAPYARFIPRAALAGILMVSAWKMIDWRALAYHLKATRFDSVIVWVTAFSAVAISIEFCVLIGVMMSSLLTVRRAGRMLLTNVLDLEVYQRPLDGAVASWSFLATTNGPSEQMSLDLGLGAGVLGGSAELRPIFFASAGRSNADAHPAAL